MHRSLRSPRPDSPADDGAAVSSERQSLREKWASISFEKKVAMFIAPVFVAVVTGVVIPMLRPDGSSDTKPRTAAGVNPTLTITEMEPGVVLGEFRDRTASQGGAPTARNDFAEGTVLYVRVAPGGVRRESLILKWFAYNANTKRRLPGLSATADALFRAEAPANVQIVQLWLRDPSRPGRYFGRIELYSGNVLLDVENSKRFDIYEF